MKNGKNNSPVGPTWDEVRPQLYTREEIAACDVRVAIIGELIKAREARGITQRELERLSGVKQPVIARMERGSTNPQLDTMIKVLQPLGKTLYVGDIQRKHNPSRAKHRMQSAQADAKTLRLSVKVKKAGI